MADIQSLIGRGALFVINHSGGKDSQAMTAVVRSLVPADQTVAVHASLGEIEWPGTIAHIYRTIGETPLSVVRAKKSFFEMVERRGMWPAPAYRQCTSDLKRGPIQKEIRRLCKAIDNNLVVNCVGLRAEESASRAKAAKLAVDKALSKAGREVYTWLPIHDWTTEQVFARIEAEGQEPHWAYQAGMSRLSCSFCIMASQADLATAARLRPSLYARYAATEQRLGHTFACQKGERFLPDITGVAPEQCMGTARALLAEIEQGEGA